MTELLDVRNPRTGEHDYQICVADSDGIAGIATDLRRAQIDWLAAGLDSRIEVLQQFKSVLLQRADEVATVLGTDTGRRAIATSEVHGLAGGIDRWCTLTPTLHSSDEAPSTALPHVGIRQQLDPYPLLGVISPWSFPLLLSFIDAIPALLAGCAVIIKPSEVTPRFASIIGDIVSGIPELHSVLRFISGDGRSGAALIGQVDVVAFTGSVVTGRKVAAAAAENFIPAFLELGGKDPVVILASSDLDRASTSILRASVAATGQACQSLERVYVNRKQHDEFVALLSNKASAVPLSHPDPDSGIVGPLIFAQQADTIRAHIEDAVSKGAKIEAGGIVEELDGGFWIAPTVLTGVTHDMDIMTEETFGPVMPVMAFDDIDQAAELANDSKYGLSAAVFAGSEDEALAFAHRINAGGVSINDAGMTTMIFEASKSAYGYSGMGQSRMGPSGYLRFFRQKALYINRGDVLPIEAMAEGQ